MAAQVAFVYTRVLRRPEHRNALERVALHLAEGWADIVTRVAYRYFYDCEFVEDGRLIDLVSIGVVDEYGREFYAVSTEFDDSRALPWVRRNVLDKLPSPADPAWRSRERIRTDLFDFLTEPVRDRPAEPIELWAWYAAYDHVVLAQLWGAMPALPREIPRFTKDLRQMWDDVDRKSTRLNSSHVALS